MADITDPAVIAFVAERKRIRAELIRDLKEILEDDASEYNGTISALLAGYANEDTVTDQNAGAKPVTKADILTAQTRDGQLLAVLQAAFAMDVYHKFTIRPLGSTNAI